MRITRSTELQLPGVRILHFERLVDKRGYFTEHYSKDEVAQALACAVGESFDVKQVLPNRLPQMLVLFVWLRNTSGISTLAPRAAFFPFFSECANASNRQMRMPP